MKNPIEKLSHIMNTSRGERRRDKLEKSHTEDVEMQNRLKDKMKDIVIDSEDLENENKGTLFEYNSIIRKADYYVREIDLINRELNTPRSSAKSLEVQNIERESLNKMLVNKRNSLAKLLNRLKLSERLSDTGRKPEVVFEEYIKKDKNERQEEWLKRRNQ